MWFFADLIADTYPKDFKNPGRRPRASPMSVATYVIEGESQRATPPKLERRKVQAGIQKSLDSVVTRFGAIGGCTVCGLQQGKKMSF